MVTLGVIVFGLFMPKVYALSYDINLKSSSSLNLDKGSSSEVIMKLENINAGDSGISICIFDIKTTGGVVLNSNVRSLGSWSVTAGTHYMADTFEEIKTSSDVIAIPVKVNGDGSLIVSNITCSSEYEEKTTQDKTISFTVKKDNIIVNDDKVNQDKEDNNIGGNTTEEDTSHEEVKSSNCDLSNILISDGRIDFDSNILEYSVDVTDIESLTVTPVLADNKASYDIIDGDIIDNKKTIKIIVKAENEITKTYTLYVSKKLVEDSVDSNKNSMNYKIIFIGLITLLIIINLIRIIKKRQSINNNQLH